MIGYKIMEIYFIKKCVLIFYFFEEAKE